MHRIFTTSVASVYPHYVAKVEKKGRTQAELDEVIDRDPTVSEGREELFPVSAEGVGVGRTLEAHRLDMGADEPEALRPDLSEGQISCRAPW